MDRERLHAPISTHTPHAGSDDIVKIVCCIIRDLFQLTLPPCGGATSVAPVIITYSFNSHSSCEERRSQAMPLLPLLLFQLTLLMRGSNAFWESNPMPTFQFTLPMRGATRRQVTSSCLMPFQLTLPIRGVTLCDISTHFNSHSPCGERPMSPEIRAIFQLTLPIRGATKTMRYRLFSFCLIGISTHTPCAGRLLAQGATVILDKRILKSII